ncbi:claudin 6, gene 1 [Pelobates cultripes]|uniref:Claudin n=1 Tax=Pelobates cultripes TaxID=61616 RepID=A0AAD1SW64_PELCU|nr:claudin 6, gene 1 [Pelobates cultripes]
MASTGLQLLGLVLALIGWVGGIITCALPMWKVSAFIGNNIVVSQVVWEGLWMNCVVQSTGQMQCKVYDSLLALPRDLQAARALTIIGILVALLAMFIAIVGAKCTNCVEEENTKAKVSVVSGIVFLVAGLLMLIPVCWSANNIIRDFYNPLVSEAQKRELGASLYIGWAASALLLLGGGMLCCSCPKKNDVAYTARYTAATSQPRSDYPTKNYV